MVGNRLPHPALMVFDFPPILCPVPGCPRAEALHPHQSHNLSPGPNRALFPVVPLGGQRAMSGGSPPPGPLWSPYGRWSDSGGLPGLRYHSSGLSLLGTAHCPGVS